MSKTKWRLRGKTWQFVSRIPAPVEVMALSAIQVAPELAAKSKPHQRDAVAFLDQWGKAEKSFAMGEREGIPRAEFIDAMKQTKDAGFMAYLEMSKHYSVEQVRN